MESSRPTNWWDAQTEEYLEEFLRTEKEGLQHPSRIATRKLVKHLMYNADAEFITVLDVGCGAGVELENYCQIPQSKRKLWYTGLDASQKMISVCQRKFFHDPQSWNCRSFGFTQLPAHDLQWNDNTQDLVLLRHVLEHLEDGYEKAMDEALRVAKDLVVVIFFEPPGAEEKLQVLEETGAVTAEVPHNLYSVEKWDAYLESREVSYCIVEAGDNRIYGISKRKSPEALTAFTRMIR